MSEGTTTEPTNAATDKIASGTSHAKAALDETAAAAREVLEVGKQRAQTAIAASKEHLSQAAKDLGEAATAKFQEIRTQATARADQYRGRAQDVFSTAQSRAQGAQGDAEQYIRDNPLQAVGIAAAAGFLIGLILRR